MGMAGGQATVGSAQTRPRACSAGTRSCRENTACRMVQRGAASAASRAQSEFLTQGPWPEDQLVYFTCLPWFPLTALTNERDDNPADSIPRVGWGRWEERGARTVLNLSLELNHRLLDGVHAGRFYETLCRDMGRLEALL